jgi:hypothetical protein
MLSEDEKPIHIFSVNGMKEEHRVSERGWKNIERKMYTHIHNTEKFIESEIEREREGE